MPPQEGPPRIKPDSLAGYFEVMTKAVFQSGISWRVVEAKWDGFRAALKGFDPSKVAGLTPRDVDRLVEATAEFLVAHRDQLAVPDATGVGPPS